MGVIEIIKGVVLPCVQLFVTSATGIGVVAAFLKFTHKPADAVKERLTALETRLDDMDSWKEDVDRRLNDDDSHFKALDESNKVTQRALLAIMDNALGNEDGEAELKDARKMLYEHLSEK